MDQYLIIWLCICLNSNAFDGILDHHMHIPLYCRITNVTCSKIGSTKVTHVCHVPTLWFIKLVSHSYLIMIRVYSDEYKLITSLYRGISSYRGVDICDMNLAFHQYLRKKLSKIKYIKCYWLMSYCVYPFYKKLSWS